MLVFIEAIILGLIEGLTEFLPVSSTGHLIVAEHVLHFEDVQSIFTVVIQLGAIAAVVWYFREDLIRRTTGLLRREPNALRFWKLLAIGTIPAGTRTVLPGRRSRRVRPACDTAVAARAVRPSPNGGFASRQAA